MRLQLGKARAFTLVELLVVIGIIAALIGILLPVLSGVQARGRDIKCQSNLRQIVQAIYAYCAENKGSMPWGFVWNKSRDKEHPDPWNPANTWGQHPSNPNFEYMSWASLIGKFMGNRGSPIDDDQTIGAALRVIYPPVLQCPEAAQSREHVVGYAMNMIVAVSPYYEFFIPDARSNRTAQLRPPQQSMMLKDTVLLWDTGIRPNWSESPGHLIGADIDREERFWYGARTPQWRYFDQADPYSRIPGSFQLSNNRPVYLSWPGLRFYNLDPDTTASGSATLGRWPYQGNLRFRHNKNTVCNAGFADGSVRQFTCKMNPDKSVDQPNHDALRRYFMIKWPTGTPRDPTRP